MKSLGSSSKSASGGLRELAGNMRATSTVAKGALGIPALIAAIGGLAPVVTAAAGATGQLAIVLGEGLGGAATTAGTALGGAVVGLRAYSAAISRTISDSRAAYEATHELAMTQLENQRNTILNTQASIKFNEQINESVLRLTKLEAAIGTNVFPAFTKELDYWNENITKFTPKIAATAGALAVMTAKFSEFVRTAQDGRLLEDIFTFINESAIRAAMTLDAVGRSGLLAFQRMIPFAKQFQLDVEHVAIAFNQWFTQTKNLNAFSQILGTLDMRFRQLLGVAVDLGQGLFNVFQGLSAGGAIDSMAMSLIHGAQAFEKLTSSASGGQQALANFMRNAQPTLKALGGLARLLSRSVR